jgi:hypothetical protein
MIQLDFFGSLEAEGPATVIPQVVPPARQPLAKVVPFEIHEPFSGIQWLHGMIGAGEYMVFLFGRNPHVCQVKSCSSWENGVPDLVARAWVMRNKAEGVLTGAGYVHDSNYSHGLDWAKIFIRRV